MSQIAKRYRGASLLVLGLAVAGSGSGALAQETARLVDISTCVELRVAVERLACYDSLGASSVPAAGTGPAAASTAPAAEEAVTDTPSAAPAPGPEVASFGQELSAAAGRIETNADGEAELIDEIVDMQERVPGRYLITLASGQVWYQTNSQRMRLRKGMQVRIYPSALGGSWRMARADGEQSGFIQVTRVE